MNTGTEMHRKSDGLPAVTQICRNIKIAGRRTSVRMESVFWTTAEKICKAEKISLAALCDLVDDRRGTNGMTASLRVLMIAWYCEEAGDKETRFQRALDYLKE